MLALQLGLSAIRTPLYNTSKFFVSMLNCLTINELTIDDSFSFAKEIVEQDNSLYTGNLDVDSLFTTLHLKKLFILCIEFIYNQKILLNV